MRIEDVVLPIQNSTILMEEIPEVREMLENEIESCKDIIQDEETQLHSRLEFQSKLALYRKLLNRL